MCVNAYMKVVTGKRSGHRSYGRTLQKRNRSRKNGISRFHTINQTKPVESVRVVMRKGSGYRVQGTQDIQGARYNVPDMILRELRIHHVCVSTHYVPVPGMYVSTLRSHSSARQFHIFFNGDVTEIRRRFCSDSPSPVAHTTLLLSSLSAVLLCLEKTMREELARLLDGLTGTVRFDNADPRWVACLLTRLLFRLSFCESNSVIFICFSNLFLVRVDLRRKTCNPIDTTAGMAACLWSLCVAVSPSLSILPPIS